MRIKLFIGLVTLFFGITGSLSFSSDPETINIMPFIDDTSYCLKCHASDEEKDMISTPAFSCTTYCLTCHKKVDNKTHHTVDVKVLEKKDNIFKYSRIGNISCFTCHNLLNNRFDSQPWKSQSLFDKTFKKKNLYKTYYLVIQNENGQLCKACH